MEKLGDENLGVDFVALQYEPKDEEDWTLIRNALILDQVIVDFHRCAKFTEAFLAVWDAILKSHLPIKKYQTLVDEMSKIVKNFNMEAKEIFGRSAEFDMGFMTAFLNHIVTTGDEVLKNLGQLNRMSPMVAVVNFQLYLYSLNLTRIIVMLAKNGVPNVSEGKNYFNENVKDEVFKIDIEDETLRLLTLYTTMVTIFSAYAEHLAYSLSRTMVDTLMSRGSVIEGQKPTD